MHDEDISREMLFEQKITIGSFGRRHASPINMAANCMLCYDTAIAIAAAMILLLLLQLLQTLR